MSSSSEIMIQDPNSDEEFCKLSCSFYNRAHCAYQLAKLRGYDGENCNVFKMSLAQVTGMLICLGIEFKDAAKQDVYERAVDALKLMRHGFFYDATGLKVPPSLALLSLRSRQKEMFNGYVDLDYFERHAKDSAYDSYHYIRFVTAANSAHAEVVEKGEETEIYQTLVKILAAMKCTLKWNSIETINFIREFPVDETIRDLAVNHLRFVLKVKKMEAPYIVDQECMLCYLQACQMAKITELMHNVYQGYKFKDGFGIAQHCVDILENKKAFRITVSNRKWSILLYSRCLAVLDMASPGHKFVRDF